MLLSIIQGGRSQGMCTMDDSLDEKRDLASKHRKRFRRSGNPMSNNLYKEARSQYKKALRSAKRLSMRIFKQTAESTTDMSLLLKIAKAN